MVDRDMAVFSDGVVVSESQASPVPPSGTVQVAPARPEMQLRNSILSSASDPELAT